MQEKNHTYPDIAATASATETTGLMQTVPESDEELADYQQLAGMEIPKRG